jgi:hypothetical protein
MNALRAGPVRFAKVSFHVMATRAYGDDGSTAVPVNVPRVLAFTPVGRGTSAFVVSVAVSL